MSEQHFIAEIWTVLQRAIEQAQMDLQRRGSGCSQFCSSTWEAAGCPAALEACDSGDGGALPYCACDPACGKVINTGFGWSLSIAQLSPGAYLPRNLSLQPKPRAGDADCHNCGTSHGHDHVD